MSPMMTIYDFHKSCKKGLNKKNEYNENENEIANHLMK